MVGVTSNPPQKRAVLLLSGGLDSATVLGILRAEGWRVHALSFDYGQRHRLELEAAQALAQQSAVVAHTILPIPMDLLGGSSLTDLSMAVPEEAGRGIPNTYVPARNLIFLSLAASLAESQGIGDLFIGVNAVDYSGYPDCRPAFIEAFETAIALGTRAADGAQRLRIHAPLIQLSKAEIIQRGVALGVDYGATLSCYQVDKVGRACGLCESCRLRRAGFEAAGVEDPTRYRS
ncbi:MAG: 7-cyano-7-deazaguanine synthase QueC [Gammaproteobacteria bacterium]